MSVMNFVSLLGGLSLFLFGMKVMGDSLEQAAGSRMKKLLAMVTHNRFLSLLVGIVITTLIQSSSATTVMVVGFVNANLINLTQAAGIIMGANIGTTTTSLLLSVKLDFGVIFACLGLLMKFLPKKWEAVRETGGIMMGLGILFIGMDTMSTAMAPLRDWEGFRNVISAISSPLAGVAAGAVITAVLQSSSASVGILQVMAGEGLVPLNTAVFILFGMNIGTCVTAMIAASGTGINAKRTAMIHLLFNIIGTVIFVVFACILPFSEWISNAIPGNFRLQVAAVHIIFNVVTTMLLLPAAPVLERLACLLVRDKESDEEKSAMRYFDANMLKTPPIAVSQLFLEVKRMGALALENCTDALACFNEWDSAKGDHIRAQEDDLDRLNDEITAAMVEVNALDLGDSDKRLIGSMFHVVNDIERLGDHAINICEYAERKEREEIKFSRKSLEELNGLSDIIMAQLNEVLSVFGDQDTTPERLAAIEETEARIDATTDKLREEHLERLKNRKCSAKSGMMYNDMLTNLERIGDHADNIGLSVDKTTPVGIN